MEVINKKSSDYFLNNVILKSRFIIKRISTKELLFSFLLLFFIFSLGFGIRLKTINEPYLLDIDSFYWERLARSVLNGEINEYDIFRVHPNPPRLNISFFVYLNVFAYKFFRLFFNIDFNRFLFWFPALIASSSVFSIYIIGKELFNKRVGFLAAFLATLSPIFLNRTMAGIFDTDGFNVLFSSLAVAFFLISFRNARLKRLKGLTFYAVLAGIFLSFFSLTWPHYGFIFWLLFALLIFNIFFEINNSKQGSLKFFLLSYFIFFFIFIGINLSIQGINFLKLLPQTIIDIFNTLFRPIRNSRMSEDIFPNIAVTIPESVSFIKHPLLLIQLIGEVIFIFGIPGLFLMIYLFFAFIFKKESTILFQKIFSNKNLLLSSFLLLFWFFPLFIGIMFSYRFAEYLVLPVSILSAFSICFSIFAILKISEHMKGKGTPILTSLAILLIIGYCFLYPFRFANTNTNSIKTSINENIESAMNHLVLKTPQNSVVVSYWKWGYWIESLARRPTVIDPGAMNDTKITSTKDLRQLDCAADRKGYIKNEDCITSRAQDIDITFYIQDEKKAVEILKSYLGNAGEMYYLISDDLIYDSYWWSYFATWDRQDNKEGKHYEIFPLEQIYPQEQKFYSDGEKINEILQIEKGNLGKEEILEKGKLIEYENPQKLLKGFLWVDFWMEEVFYIPTELKDSLFVKLFFFDERNSPYFKLEYANKKIKIFKVIFNTSASL